MPSKKQRSKQKKQNKLLKKTLNIKPYDQKQQEIETINEQIKDIGFPDTDENIIKFNKIVKDYLENDIAWSGKIPLKGYQRIMHVVLSNRKNITNSVMLKYDKNV